MKSTLLVFAFAAWAIPLASGAHEGGHDVRGVVVSVSGADLTVKTSHGSEKFVLTPRRGAREEKERPHGSGESGVRGAAGSKEEMT